MPVSSWSKKGICGKKEAKTRQVQAWPLRPTKPSRQEFENTSPFLKQMVRLVTAARRCHRGDLVWMCWDGTDDRSKNPKPEHASTMLALSFRGAQALQGIFWPELWRSHFDLSLKWVCERHAKELEACFVVPSIGHYNTHDSDILEATRPSQWDRWYVGEGQGRVQLRTWETGKKLATIPIADFNLSEENSRFDWLTWYRESDTPLVEPVATSRSPSPHNKMKRREQDPRKVRTQVEMENAFDVQRMIGHQEATTQRQKRQKRRYTRDGAFRIFTTDILKASWGSPFRFKSQLYLLRHIQACELVAHAWRRKNPHSPTHPSCTG